MFLRVIRILPLFFIDITRKRHLTKLKASKENNYNKIKKNFIPVISIILSFFINYKVKAMEFENLSYDNFSNLLNNNKINFVIIKKAYTGLYIVFNHKIYNLNYDNKDINNILNQIKLKYIPIKYEFFEDFLSTNLHKIELIPIKNK